MRCESNLRRSVSQDHLSPTSQDLTPGRRTFSTCDGSLTNSLEDHQHDQEEFVFKQICDLIPQCEATRSHIDFLKPT